jgi:hypothetical protein
MEMVAMVTAENGVAVLYKLVIDGRSYEVDLPELSGLQIRALAAIDPTYTLVLESGDARGHDRMIDDNDVIKLEDRPVLFCRPPTAMG